MHVVAAARMIWPTGRMIVMNAVRSIVCCRVYEERSVSEKTEPTVEAA